MHKTALVTGATRGIGLAVTESLIARGFTVIAVYKSSKEIAHNLSKKFGDKIITLQADVSRKEGIQLIEIQLAKIGTLDILINNAGLNYTKEIALMDFEDFDLVINTNLKSVVFCTKVAIPYLEKTKGVIINISSRGGFCDVAWDDTSLYCIAKAGVNNFSMNCARAFKDKGVRVNVVIPTPTQTDLLQNVFTKEEIQELAQSNKLGEPNDVAKLVLKLIDNKYATGKILFDNRI